MSYEGVGQIAGLVMNGVLAGLSMYFFLQVRRRAHRSASAACDSPAALRAWRKFWPHRIAIAPEFIASPSSRISSCESS